MEKEQFVKLTLEAEETMFHIAFSILHHEQDCSDAVQEAVVKAYAKRNTLKHTAYFKTWLIKMEVSPFRIRLYADENLAPHTVWGSRTALAGVWYEDGTSIEDESLHLSMLGHTDEAGAYYFELWSGALEYGETRPEGSTRVRQKRT